MFRGRPFGVAWLWLSGNGCVCRLTGFTATGEGRVEEFNLLRHAVFRNRKVFRFEIGDGLALFVFDDHVKIYEV